MAKYRFAFSNMEYGNIVVEADSFDEAVDKAYSLDGDYYAHSNEVTNASFLEMVDT